MRKEIQTHRQSYDPQNVRDLVDLYIQMERSDFEDNEWMDGNSSLIQYCS